MVVINNPSLNKTTIPENTVSSKEKMSDEMKFKIFKSPALFMTSHRKQSALRHDNCITCVEQSLFVSLLRIVVADRR